MNVLILSEFSEVSKNAASYALDFLHNQPSRIYLLNITRLNFDKTASDLLDEQLISISRNLKSEIKRLKSYNTQKGHTFHRCLSSEDLISATLNAVKEYEIDLIFLGAASDDFHEHPIFGIHAYQVLKQVPCDFITVPFHARFKPDPKLLFPIDPETFKKKNFDFDKMEKFLNFKKIQILELNEDEEDTVICPAATAVFKKYKNLVIQGTEWKILLHSEKSLWQAIQHNFDHLIISASNLHIFDEFFPEIINIENRLPILIMNESH